MATKQNEFLHDTDMTPDHELSSSEEQLAMEAEDISNEVYSSEDSDADAIGSELWVDETGLGDDVDDVAGQTDIPGSGEDEVWDFDGDDPDNPEFLADPLDIEYKLEEELAALEADMAAAEESLANDQTNAPGEDDPALSETPIPQNKSKRRKVDVPEDTEADLSAAPEFPPSDTAKGKRKVTRKQSAAKKATEPPAPTAPASSTAIQKPASGSGGFYQIDFHRLDRGLSDPERQEWNAIYASFRSKSILTGTVIGVDENKLPVKDKDGKTVLRRIRSLIVIAYRVKVLIPENSIWIQGEEHTAYMIREMIGATIDYVITAVDREGEVALASRALGMVKRRRAFLNSNSARPGSIVPCTVIASGPKRCLVSCGGYDVSLRTEDMSYTAILDMRPVYRPGQELKAKIISHKPREKELVLSVKETTPHPFIGAERRHPVGTRRQAVISSKYAGGVFCSLADGTVVMCLYSNVHNDADFLLGDNVIVHIAHYDNERQFVYGRIAAKW